MPIHVHNCGLHYDDRKVYTSRQNERIHEKRKAENCQLEPRFSFLICEWMNGWMDEKYIKKLKKDFCRSPSPHSYDVTLIKCQYLCHFMSLLVTIFFSPLVFCLFTDCCCCFYCIISCLLLLLSSQSWFIWNKMKLTLSYCRH